MSSAYNNTAVQQACERPVSLARPKRVCYEARDYEELKQVTSERNGPGGNAAGNWPEPVTVTCTCIGFTTRLNYASGKGACEPTPHTVLHACCTTTGQIPQVHQPYLQLLNRPRPLLAVWHFLKARDDFSTFDLTHSHSQLMQLASLIAYLSDTPHRRTLILTFITVHPDLDLPGARATTRLPASDRGATWSMHVLTFFCFHSHSLANASSPGLSVVTDHVYNRATVHLQLSSFCLLFVCASRPRVIWPWRLFTFSASLR